MNKNTENLIEYYLCQILLHEFDENIKSGLRGKTQAVEPLFCKWEALSSIPSPTKK
jgi:hypothetical protein